MGLEIELKYAATAQAQTAVMAAYPGSWQTIRMETTYYDTPEGSLSQRWYTLRRRLVNEASVCTIKTPVDGLGRGEWEVLCQDIHLAIPELCKLGCPADLLALTAGGVIPVCGARFTRQALTIRFRDSVLELALDSGVLFGGSREIPLCEIEVELKEGSREDILLFGAMLAKAHGLQPQPGSKFRRALALKEEG